MRGVPSRGRCSQRPQRRAMRQLPQRRRLERDELRSRGRQRLRAARQPSTFDLRVVPRDEPCRGACRRRARAVIAPTTRIAAGSARSAADCHNARQWSETSFDHSRVSDFRARRRACEARVHELPHGRARSRSRARVHVVPRRGPASGPSRRALRRSATRSSAWRAPLRFDHGLVAFPLLGKHSALAVRRLPCVARVPRCGRELRGLPCGAGRRTTARSAPTCGACHNPRDWQRSVVRPRGANRFRADGRTCARDVLDVPRRRSVSPPRARRLAANATRQDDPHGGRFGADCASCHSTDSFSEIRRR